MNEETSTDSTTVDEQVPAPGAEAADEHEHVGGEPDGQGPDAQSEASTLDRKLTRENASLRKRLRDTEEKLKAREDAELSEQEKAMKRLAEMESELEASRASLRDTRLRAAIAAEAPRLGIVDADAATRLLDVSLLDYDPGTGWEGVSDALRALAQERPWLVSTATPAGSEANPANPARRRSRLTRDALKSMSEAEIAALPWEDVQAALADS